MKAEQKSEKAAAPLTADELKKQLDKAGIKAGNVENSAKVISIGTKSSVTFDKYYGDANHDGKIDVSGIGPWNAIAIGQSATVHNSANAIGIGGGAGGGETVVDNSVGAVGIGTHTQIKDSDQAVTYGIDSQITESAGAVSYGGHSSIENSKLGTSVGYGSSLKNSPSSVALGDFSSVTDSTQSAAIGIVYNKSTNSVALGAFSTVNGESGVISVGHKATDLYPLDSEGKATYGSDFFRRITNVADGKDAHDTATVGQVENGYVAYDKDGDTVDKKSVSLGGVNGSGTELKNVSGITFKGTNNNMILTGTAGGKAQVKNSGNSIVLSTLGGGAGQNRPQTTISDTNEAISIGNSNTVTVDKNSDFYKNNQPYWFNGNVAVGTQVELTNAGESVGLGSATEVKDSIASTAVGYASKVDHSTYASALGNHTSVTNSDRSVAVGPLAKVDNSMMSVAIGQGAASLNGNFNVALGSTSAVHKAYNSVALGSNSIVADDQSNVISVGHKNGDVMQDGKTTYEDDLFRKITNVADGKLAEGSHEAVTGGQLYTVQQKADNSVQYDSADKSSVTFGGGEKGTALKNVNDIVFNVAYQNTYGFDKQGTFSFVDAGVIPGKVLTTGKDNFALGTDAVIGYDKLDGSAQSDRPAPNYNVVVGNHASIDGGVSSSVVIGNSASASNWKANEDGTYPELKKIVAIGQAATADHSNATSVGASASVGGTNGTALGAETEARADNSTAVGGKVMINGDAENSVAIGGDSYSEPNGTGSIKYNKTEVAYGAANSTIVGVGAYSQAKYGTSLGADTRVSSENGLALGAHATVNFGAKNSVSLGADSNVNKENLLADGSESLHGVVSVGKSGDYGFTRRIINVADGVNDFDAVNKKQLNAVDSKVTGLSDSAVQYDKNEDGTTNYGSVTFKGAGEDAGTNLKNIGTIRAANGWFYLDSNGKVSTYDLALSDGDEYNSFKDAGLVAGKVTAPAGDNTFDNLVIGSGAKVDNMDTENAFAKQNTAVGNKAQILPGFDWVEDSEGKVTAKRANSVSGSSAFGAGAQVTGNNSSAFGFNANVVNDLGVAIGYNAKAGKSSSKDDDGKATAIGAESNAGGNWSTALGYYAQATVDKGTAVGANTSLGYGTEGSVALGARSVVTKDDLLKDDAGKVTETNGVVSVGDSNYGTNSKYSFQRRIINVADGVNKFDAVNKGQLDAVDSKLTTYENAGIKAGVAVKNGIALGDGSASGENGTTVGVSATAEKGATAFGNKAYAAENSVALGNNAVTKLGVTNAVVLGTNSVATESNTVSVGSKDNTRKITNVKDGVADTDAATVGQISKITGTDSEKGAVVQYDKNKNGTTNYDSVTFKGANGTVLNNVADIALPAYKGHYSTFVGSGLVNGVVYDTTANSQWAENGSEKTSSIAIGRDSNVRGTSSLAVGIGATVGTGDNSTVIANGTALGTNAKAGGQNGTAVGEEAEVAGDNGAAFGYQAKAEADSTAIGTNATAGYSGAGEAVAIGKSANVQFKQGVALGNNTEIMAEQGTALGYGAQISWNGKNSVALGAGSIANEEDVVSVGRAAGQGGNVSNPAITRRIVNVADGRVATDAATVGQLEAKVKGASSKVEAEKDNNNITVKSTTNENGTIYTVGLSNNLDLTKDGSISFGTAGSKLDGKGLTINNVTYVSDAGLNAGGNVIKNVAAGKDDTDAVNKGQMKAAIKNAGLSTDTDGNVNVGGDQTGKLNLNNDGSASLTNNKGDKGFFVDKDGNNTIKGNTTIDGTLTFQDANGNKDTVATGTDISGIKKEIGVNADGTYKKIDNGAATVIDGINTNTAAIKTNTAAIKMNTDNIGATGDKGALKLKNGEKTIEAGINKNTADIANNAAAIQQNKDNIMALGGAVSELDTRVDRVGAGAAALAALHPLDYDPANKWDFAAGYGHYQGANAVAIGTYYRPSENTMISLGGSFGGGENMVNAGVSFKVGDGSTSTSRTAMATKINALETHNKALEDRVAAQDETIKEMQAQIQQLLKAQQPAK